MHKADCAAEKLDAPLADYAREIIGTESSERLSLKSPSETSTAAQLMRENERLSERVAM